MTTPTDLLQTLDAFHAEMRAEILALETAPPPDPEPEPEPSPIPPNAKTVLPTQSLATALRDARPGDTLVLRGGSRTEDVVVTPTKGTSTQPIRVMAYPGERYVLTGRLSLDAPDYWDIAGLNVKWRSGLASNVHMVKMNGGKHWRLHHCEFWDAHSYAALLVTDLAANFRVDHCHIHDTIASNGANQDHLIYVAEGSAGEIDHNLLRNAPNGRGVKIGADPPRTSGRNIKVHHNTIIDCHGPALIQVSYESNDNLLYRNILVRPGAGEAAITHYNLSGTGNRAYEDLWWQATRAVQTGDSGLVDEGRHVNVDPKFDSAFRPTNPAAAGYGHTAA